jgi:hypothetical protein
MAEQTTNLADVLPAGCVTRHKLLQVGRLGGAWKTCATDQYPSVFNPTPQQAHSLFLLEFSVSRGHVPIEGLFSFELLSTDAALVDEKVGEVDGLHVVPHISPRRLGPLADGTGVTSASVLTTPEFSRIENTGKQGSV